ncbi:UNVERIFIED_CONTAM: hypothetical protein PYX00_008855 [Menopon gallinae]|uniref:Uncharacterized protein n=1 Tax=Menopon gallinae TaxID=328185 RepID=A0AAW2H971_9NEOP
MVEDIRQMLENVRIPHVRFNFDEEYFGRLECAFDDLHVVGLNRFDVTLFDPSFEKDKFGIKNLTVTVSPLNISGKYNLDGKIIFPIGNDAIHVFGNGDARIDLEDVSGWFQLYLKSKAGQIKVKELDIMFDIGKMDMKLSDIMGGGELEDVFNELFNVLGPTVIEHYKPGLIKLLKEKLTDILNEQFK